MYICIHGTEKSLVLVTKSTSKSFIGFNIHSSQVTTPDDLLLAERILNMNAGVPQV